jgi:hypothetical protein
MKNQKELTTGKKNGVYFDKKYQRWNACVRQDNKLKYLGSFVTYNEAREAREKAENGNEFYKQGNGKDFDGLNGRDFKNRRRGQGRICQNDYGNWRVILIRSKEKLLDKTYKSKNDAEKALAEAIQSANQ